MTLRLTKSQIYWIKELYSSKLAYKLCNRFCKVSFHWVPIVKFTKKINKEYMITNLAVNLHRLSQKYETVSWHINLPSWVILLALSFYLFVYRLGCIRDIRSICSRVLANLISSTTLALDIGSSKRNAINTIEIYLSMPRKSFHTLFAASILHNKRFILLLLVLIFYITLRFVWRWIKYRVFWRSTDI